MDESQQALVGQNLQVLPRNLYAEDGDRGIQAPILYSFDQSNSIANQDQPVSPTTASLLGAGGGSQELGADIEQYLHLNPTSGEIRLIRQWPSKWTGPPLTLVVRAAQADNRDRYTLTTLTIRRSPLAQHSQTLTGAASSSAATDKRQQSQPGKQQQGQNQRQWIEFEPVKLIIDVAEDTPVNEKIARVRARYLASREQESVDLVQDSSISNKLSTALNGTGRVLTRLRNSSLEQSIQQQQQQANKRLPINYLILDDQTDQFAINGLGELSLKRPLDYELRQEYKIRVLATYTKYSDICLVQVNVINVNDNKPKVS